MSRSEQAAIVMRNANVITCDSAHPVASTVTISDGRIRSVGDDGEPAGDAVSIDLQGATVLPGFIDTHPHLMHFGTMAEYLVDLSDAESHADIVGRIEQRARATPEGEWIMATPVGEPHYFIRRSYRDLAEAVLPDRSVLDRAAPDHPVFIQAWAPVVPNVCAMNSAALHRLGISASTPDRVDDVWIEKDSSGEPTGRLHGSVTNYYCDSPFMNDLFDRMPLFRGDAVVPGTERAMRAANEAGVTTVYEAHLMTTSLIAMYRWLREQDKLTVRVLCAPEAEPVGLPWTDPLQPASFRERLEGARELVDRSDDLFRIDGVTISPYGPCWPGFTQMREPYGDPYGRLTNGRVMVSPERVSEAIEFCHAHDVRLNLVASGTSELDSHFTQLEALGSAPLDADGRAWILQHFYFAEPDLVARAAALGLDVTTTMSFSWGKGEVVRERFGEDILEDFIPVARLLAADLRVAAGTDWGPKNVFEHIALAVEPRYGASGRRAPTPGISRQQALDMWTRDAAHVLRWEGIGSIAAGNAADLVIVDQDPLSVPVADLPKTSVLSTILGGRTVAGRPYLEGEAG